ncbi:MAG: metallopeptidase family protein [Chloroflexi bacterium]|nr:metallopeptidase family protein [Chloroflexota bacterium]
MANDRGPRRATRRRRTSQSAYEFERLVAESLDGLPERFRQRLANVAVVVEDEPSPEEQDETGHDQSEPLFGLYQGTPLTARGSGYGMVLPDKITIFRGPIERFCRSRREMRWEVRRTVVHEFAHHFGIDDDHLDELGI